MTGNYLLDTNIIVAFLKGESSIVERVVSPIELKVCSIIIGELLYGAYNSTKVEANLERVEQVKELIDSIPINDGTAAVYGRLKQHLKRNGTPIPENDVWIAAIALQNNLTLATRDRHFDKIDGLVVENW
ncbi:type II toxin-antitoxin system VapC family toxin [Tellurirhabdus rosea]|uniref:type II toxin-antitoxin system VapC family toxin n=1 Tax=Tellurirhabdus rosea TaxID=2674997 RepID=UPI00225BFB87|nr:type II toxin-antitoxin system VapC family toxin [Tellurirhabdus rosea]